MSPITSPVSPGLLSAERAVPAGIPRPGYIANGGVPVGRDLAPLSDAGDIARLRRSCRAARRVLERMGPAVRPGVTTDELDAIAHEAYVIEGGYPSPLGYRGFPKSICTSVNEVVAHGIPDSRALCDGDIVNCDITIFLDGMHGDCSATFEVGQVTPDVQHLVETTSAALDAGVGAVRPGGRLRDVGRAIQGVAHGNGYGIVRELVGHGIGEEFHSAPYVHHYDEPRDRTRLQPGMVFTIEPMLTLGEPDVVQWDDGWTIVTLDGRASAQFEHTVIVTPAGVEVLTILD
ncbi:MAG: type I methionyl aminopeptidase [Acidimicrobiales bacterium]